MRQLKSVGAIVFRKEEGKVLFLLLKNSKGHWDFAKGLAEQGETEEQTLRREASEEAGLTDLAIMPSFREEISYFFKEQGELVRKTVAFYLAETKQEKITLSFEHTEFAWLEYEKALETVSYKNAKELLTKAKQQPRY